MKLQLTLLLILIINCSVIRAQNIGIGETAPSNKLSVKGNLSVGSGYSTTAAPANGAIIQGNVGIGTTSPQVTFDIVGTQYIRDNATLASVTSGLKIANTGGVNYIESASSGMAGAADLDFTSMNAGNTWMVIKASGNVGIGIATPTAALSVTNTNGTELGGSSASGTFKTYAGSLGTTLSSTLKLGSLGFSSSNQSSLGVKAIRTLAGSSWYTTASTISVGLEMDIDATDAAGGAIWLNGNGAVGIGATNTTPLSALSVGGAGNIFYEGYFNQTSNTAGSGYVSPTGLYATVATPASGSSYGIGVQGVITSGNGYAIAILGNSSGGGGSAGRAYGVYGQAGGATSGYNYGVHGALLNGGGNGAGVYGVDQNTYTSVPAAIPGTYAGYFDGKVGINGYLGIGPAASGVPQAPLHVFSNSATVANIAIKYFSYAATSPNNTLQNTNPWTTGVTTAYFQGNVLATSSYISCNGNATFSDNRIKKIIGISDKKIDLETLNKVEITKYKYIDTIGMNNRVHTKVIAQQVEKIYPEAISYFTTFIPDMYEVAKNFTYDATSETLKIKLSKAHHLYPCDRVKWLQKDGVDNLDEVASIVDSCTFTIHTKIKPSEVFVYGKEVSDFRVVDYDALSMLNISAVQELSRKVTALEQENVQLKKDNCDLTDKVNAVSSTSADIQLLQKQLAEVKAMMDKYNITSDK